VEGSEIFPLRETVDQMARAAEEELKLKQEKNEVADEQTQQKYMKYGKKIQKKKIRNKKKRTKIDI
jgi:hypothetical protein